MNTIPHNIEQFTHLTTDDKAYLAEQVQAINKLSVDYCYDYETELPSSSREGETEYLQSYDPSRYGMERNDVSCTADNIIFTKSADGEDLKVLLIQRGNHPFKGFWCHPGGFIDQSESTHQAAVRELKEETDLDVSEKDVAFVKKYDRPWRDPRMKFITMFTHVSFFPTLPAFEAGDDAADACLVSVKDIFEDNSTIQLGFDHKQSIADAITYLMD
jgi:ADP-ribose pyrophosphatase YjhB (NUDIX family)